MFERQRRAAAVDRPVEQRQHLVDLAEIVVEQRQVPPVVDLQEAVARPAVGLPRIQAMPSRCRLCISMTWATACCAQPSRGSSSIACAARRSRRAHSRRFPRARRHACRASRGSRACRSSHAGSARAMRSRSMRGIAGEEVDLVPGLQRQRVARVRRCVTSSSTRPASCQRPSARWPSAATCRLLASGRRQAWPPPRGRPWRSAVAS